MHQPISTTLMVFCLVSQVQVNGSQKSQPPLSAFQTYYTKLDQLILKKDLTSLLIALKRSHTVDFRHLPRRTPKVSTVVTNLPQMLEGVKSVFLNVDRFTESKTTASNYRVSQSSVELTVFSKLAGITHPGADRLTHKVTLTSKNLVTWVNDHGNWKVKQIVTDSDSMAVDGRYITPKG